MDTKTFDDFNNIENRIKSKIAKLVMENKLESGLKIIADELNSFVHSNIDNLYLFSISLLHDDIFDIYFPTNKEAEEKKLDHFAYLDYGLIGYYCKKSLKSGSKIYTFKNKSEILQAHEMVQRIVFASNEKIQAFVICPIIIDKIIVGAIQISLSKELMEDYYIQEFLTWLSSKICWMLFSEKNRINAIFNLAETLICALENKDNYQASHSKNVTDLVLAFLRFILHEPTYKEIFYKEYKNSNGLDILKIKLASLLHDVGKFVMTDESFNKSTANMSDYKRLKRTLHPYYTYKILSSNSLTSEIAEIASKHHERYSNDGYPWGLKSTDFTFVCQLIAFADKIDSMARERPNINSRKNIEFILDQLSKDKAKNAFERKLFNMLLTILAELRDNPNSRNLSYLPSITKLIGIEAVPTELLKVSCLNPILNNVFSSFIKEHSNIKPEEWLVVFHIKSSKNGNYISQVINNINSCKLAEKDTVICAKDSDSPSVWGIYFTKIKKEFSYKYCSDLDNALMGSSKMSAIFLDNKAVNKMTISMIESSLINEAQKMNFGDRWRLIMN